MSMLSKVLDSKRLTCTHAEEEEDARQCSHVTPAVTVFTQVEFSDLQKDLNKKSYRLVEKEADMEG